MTATTSTLYIIKVPKHKEDVNCLQGSSDNHKTTSLGEGGGFIPQYIETGMEVLSITQDDKFFYYHLFRRIGTQQT